MKTALTYLGAIVWIVFPIGCASVVHDPRVLQLTKEGQRWCTAVAIAPLRALTAAHCIMPPESPVELDGVRALDTGLWEPGVDLAALHPASPFPAFFEYATEAPTEGDALELIGYGCTGRQHRRPLRALGAGLADGQACHGDSGGPVLNGRGELVGVFSGWDVLGRLRYVQIVKQP